MKILFAVNSLGGGGAEKVLKDIVLNLDKSKYDITVMSLKDEGVYGNEIKQHASFLFYCKGNPGRRFFLRVVNKLKIIFLKYLPGLLYRMLFKEKYDVEIAFIEGMSTRLLSASVNQASRKLAWVHTDMISNPRSAHFYRSVSDQTQSYKSFDRIVCVSDTARESFIKKFGISGNVVTLYNPIDEKDILKQASESIDDLQISDRFKLIAIGRLTPEKGIDRLLEVHKRLMDDGFDHELWILGEGEQEPCLRKFIAGHRLQSRTYLLGFKENPYKYLNTCDLFVCSSRAEGYSTAVAEAFILGKPVISVECSGTRELFEDGKYGFMVDNSHEGLYRGLKKLLSDPGTYEHYKRMAAERSRYFKLEDRMREIGRLLEE